MTIEATADIIRTYFIEMDKLFRRTLFDEWALVRVSADADEILVYEGPRRDAFTMEFPKDVRFLRAEMSSGSYALGDFEFTREGDGTGIDAFIVAGKSLYLICNNTEMSMTDISADPMWSAAQVKFVALTDKLRANPCDC